MVVDASVAIGAFMPDEPVRARIVLSEAAAAGPLYAPAYWSAEVASGFLAAERRLRFTSAHMSAAFASLNELNVNIDMNTPMIAFGPLVHLARQHRLSVYDAGYLELAMRLTVPLLTFDRALAKAADAQGVHVLLQ
ncbi:type II toxin-antitoxin system VapC family toxin [Geminicoccus roseus]|uniref:type II toxin-antitoxin system VapC family toxin n=1 Tax=Geminicoccus roseus TaxID=404900 RepID=UPI0003F9DE43